MKPTLVTGATGFLGWHVAHQLVKRGDPVRALVRSAAKDRTKLLRGVGVEPMEGDLRDAASVVRAIDGCGLVFHIAADYRLWAKDPSELYRSNVDGTRNVLIAARRAGVERVVYTSTVGCIGVPPGGVGNEASPVDIGMMQGAYKRSKFLAEQVALREAETGLPVVIVNPTAPVGGYDVRPTPTGRIILDFIRRAMPAYIETGLNFVDVEDTAAGHLLACANGKSGERYILGCENLTLRQMFAKLERITGIPAPTLRIPYGVAWVAGVASTAWAHISGSPPRAPLDGVRMARKKMFVSHDKAVAELGFRPGPVNGALERAVDWFRANGYA